MNRIWLMEARVPYQRVDAAPANNEEIHRTRLLYYSTRTTNVFFHPTPLSFRGSDPHMLGEAGKTSAELDQGDVERAAQATNSELCLRIAS